MEGKAAYIDYCAGANGRPVPLFGEVFNVPARELGSAIEKRHVSLRGVWIFSKILEDMLVTWIGDIERCRGCGSVFPLLLLFEGLGKPDQNGGDLVGTENGHIAYFAVGGERCGGGGMSEYVGQGLGENAVRNGEADRAG